MTDIPGSPELWEKWLRMCREVVEQYREEHDKTHGPDDIYQGYWRVHVRMATRDPAAAAVLITCLMHIAAGYTES